MFYEKVKWRKCWIELTCLQLDRRMSRSFRAKGRMEELEGCGWSFDWLVLRISQAGLGFLFGVCCPFLLFKYLIISLLLYKIIQI